MNFLKWTEIILLGILTIWSFSFFAHFILYVKKNGRLVKDHEKRFGEGEIVPLEEVRYVLTRLKKSVEKEKILSAMVIVNFIMALMSLI